MEIKDAMLLVARANKDTYKKHICYKSEEEYEMIVNTLEHGLTPETEHERNKFCSSKYWFDTSTMSQIAADALRRLIADFATEINTVHPPRLYLPLSPPLFDARPAPYIFHSLNNHFYSIKIRTLDHHAYLERSLAIRGVYQYPFQHYLYINQPSHFRKFSRLGLTAPHSELMDNKRDLFSAKKPMVPVGAQSLRRQRITYKLNKNT
ncbi:hypothetical protein VTP01DRAFT_2836 [Rhizomucor pusillus]|uniref:uncharacterized protein n=1 Tax=Rhizomucor pusillus TaxID=4840 RepID=UPI0037449E07